MHVEPLCKNATYQPIPQYHQTENDEDEALTAQTEHPLHPCPPHCPYLATEHPAPPPPGAELDGAALVLVDSVVPGGTAVVVLPDPPPAPRLGVDQLIHCVWPEPGNDWVLWKTFVSVADWLSRNFWKKAPISGAWEEGKTQWLWPPIYEKPKLLVAPSAW